MGMIKLILIFSFIIIIAILILPVPILHTIGIIIANFINSVFNILSTKIGESASYNSTNTVNTINTTKNTIQAQTTNNTIITKTHKLSNIIINVS
jgi:ribosomal protein S5